LEGHAHDYYFQASLSLSILLFATILQQNMDKKKLHLLFNDEIICLLETKNYLKIWRKFEITMNFKSKIEENS